MGSSTNKFAGRCEDCGEPVAARSGQLSKEGERWVTRHSEGDCPSVDATPKVPEVALTPTAEQQAALDLFALGESMVIEAGAGTGKTATLKLLAQSCPTRRGQYLAFNKAIVQEAKAKFPAHVSCNTAHSLAYGVIGKQYSHRLNAPRMNSSQIARILDIDPITVTVDKVGHKTLAAGFLAGHVMEAVRLFCQSADPVPTRRHFPYIDGIDLPTPDGKRTFVNNDDIAAELLPTVKHAWADLNSLTGSLRFGHDCQPPGTLVRRVVRGGGHSGSEHEDVPIEQIREGDRVVSFTMNQRRGMVRRSGRVVTAVGSRPFSGDLIRIRTERGRSSAVTPTHICVARLDTDLAEGNYVVYLAARGDQFRIGRTTWRTHSQSNTLGIMRRADAMRADAIWVLSVHSTDEDAATAEAVTAYDYGIPTWTWRGPRTIMDRDIFWRHVGDNRARAARCLADFGLDMSYPLWEPTGGIRNFRRPTKIRACNLLSGMLVCEPDEIIVQERSALVAYEASKAWTSISLSRESYEGPVWSLNVETDHTYVADGIVTGNCYLKIWQLSDPVIDVDFILFDEAQDASQVMADIIAKQTHAQVCYVGDSNQAIYEWMGAVNTLGRLASDHRVFLTQSWRFGPKLAELANVVLAKLEAELRLIGTDSIATEIGILETEDAILCRTNAQAVSTVLQLQAKGRRPHLVGGGKEVVAFAHGAQDLMDKGHTSYGELACFSSWGEVRDYVDNDAQGGELKLLVKLVDEFSVRTILQALEHMPAERTADVIVSTAHKAKGREWDRVRLGSDFQVKDDDKAEMKLLYVAVTRARRHLDALSVAAFFAEKGEKDQPEPVIDDDVTRWVDGVA